MPIPRASPPNDMMLMETPARSMKRKVATTDTGMVRAMIAVARRSRRKKKSTRIASRPPIHAADHTIWMAAVI